MQTSNNPLNRFVQSFSQPEAEQPQIASKGTLDKNWQNVKQNITNSALGNTPQGVEQ